MLGTLLLFPLRLLGLGRTDGQDVPVGAADPRGRGRVTASDLRYPSVGGNLRVRTVRACGRRANVDGEFARVCGGRGQKP